MKQMIDWLVYSGSIVNTIQPVQPVMFITICISFLISWYTTFFKQAIIL